MRGDALEGERISNEKGILDLANWASISAVKF